MLRLSVHRLVIIFLGSAAAFAPLHASRRTPAAGRTAAAALRPARAPVAVALLPGTAEPAALPALLLADFASDFTSFQDSHAILISILLAIVYRIVIREVRYKFEKPVMDELGNKVKKSLTPDQDSIDWGTAAPKLIGCILLDLAGDASELIPVLGEFTDVAYAPIEAGLLKALFQSNLIAGFGFVEEILPFTDIIPTFTLSWCLSTLWPTTPIAKKLLPAKSA